MATFRQILSEKLNNQQKALLRTFFNEQNGKNYSRINQITNFMGYSSSDDAYEHLRNLYNDYVIEQQRLKRNQRERLARAAAKAAKQDKEDRRNLLVDYKYVQPAYIEDIEDYIKRKEKLEIEYNNIVLPKLYEIAKKLVGKKMVYIQTSFNGQIQENGSIASTNERVLFKNKLIEIKSSNFMSIFYENILPLIQTYVDGIVINMFDYTTNVRIVVFDVDTIIPERLKQKFLDGERHCVIEPIRNIFQQYLANSTSKESQRKFTRTINKLNEFEKEYVDGVPEDDLEIIGKTISRCIVINNLIGNEVKRYNTSSSKFIQFTNTRNNHLDIGHITLSNQFEKINQEQMNELVEQHDKEKVFYIFDGELDGKVARSLSSSKGNWCVVNEDYEYFQEFDKLIGKKHYGINAVEYSELNEYIKEGRIINATPVPLCNEPNNLVGVHHIDISKAYTQHKYSKFYRGFLGHIHAYAKLDNISNPLEFLESHIGMYQFKVISNKNPLLQQLGIIEKHTYLLPSVEIIAFMVDFGLKIQLISGCWGSSFDFEYTDDMLENRRYAIWAGKLGQDTKYHKFKFTGNREWAKHLAYELGSENVMYFKEQKMIIITQNKKNYNTYHHILAFITSYTRLNMLEIMRKVKGDLVKVILDGLYYRGEICDVAIPHKNDKDLKTHIGFREFWYHPSEIEVKWKKYNSKFDGNCILSGAGGTGKTYSIYTNKSLIKPLYVVPSHILGKKMRDTYGCDYTTIQRLIGDDCVSYKEMYKEPHTILIDELTMIDKKMIIKAIEIYSSSLIIIAGDIDKKRWYQCRNGNGEIQTELFMPQDWRYVEYTTDFRSKDNEIKILKQSVRNKMVEIFETGGRAESMILNEFIKANYPVVNFNDAVSKFQVGDIWIAGTHTTNKKLLDCGIVSGYINSKKQINFNGEGEKRGSFTIHSYQGLTIEKEKVFISLDNFEYAMLYTAISRCCYFHQIVFVV
jgi:hypothetical protein